MKIKVLMSSGSEDDWDDIDNCAMQMDLGGALVITMTEGGVEHVIAVYAPNMWMKFEVVEP